MAVTIPMIILGVLTAVSAACVVFTRKPLNSALWLVLTLFFIAGHFALLNAHFVAAIQVLVYAGAIMVLVIFVLMLLGAEAGGSERISRTALAGSSILGAVFAAMLCWVFTQSKLAPPSGGSADGTTAGVAHTLFGQQLFLFEAISLLILAAIIGAVALGFEKRRPLPEGRGLKAMRERNMEGAEA